MIKPGRNHPGRERWVDSSLASLLNIAQRGFYKAEMETSNGGHVFSSMGYQATAEHAKDRSRYKVNLKLPVLPLNNNIISCNQLIDISDIFIIDFKDFPKFHQTIPNYEYLIDKSIFFIVTDLPQSKISVPNEIQNRTKCEIIIRSKNSKHNISVAILIIIKMLMCHNKSIHIMSRSKLMVTAQFIDQKVFNYRDSSIVPIVNKKNKEIVKPRRFRNFSEGEITIHPVDRSARNKTAYDVIAEIVNKYDVRKIHLIDMDNVKLTRNQKNEMIRRNELPLCFGNPKKNVIYKPIIADNSIYDGIFVTILMMSPEIFNICKNQNFYLYFGYVENYFSKKSYMHDTLPKNFSGTRKIMVEFLEPLQKLFLGRELRQLSQGYVKLKNFARMMYTSAKFKNKKTQTSIVISLKCCMVMRMGKDMLIPFTEKVEFYLTFYKRDNKWDIHRLVDKRLSAESFNSGIKQFLMPINNQKRKGTEFTNNKLTPLQNVPLVHDHDDFPISPPKQMRRNLDMESTYIKPEVNAVPVENTGTNLPLVHQSKQNVHEENPCIYMPQHTTMPDIDHQKLRSLYITVPVIDECADVLMIDFITLLHFKMPEEIEFSILSQDNIFKSTVSFFSTIKTGSRKIIVQENFY